MTPSPERQYSQIYDGIVAVASHCDGAVERDDVGFNGTDTKFGRRIASVPFDAWTDDVRAEAAHIILKYREQVLRYTGVDVSTLPVVKEAQGFGTNYLARDLARKFEKRAKGAELVAQRLVDVLGSNLTFAWDRKDPDFGALLDGVKRLPGRKFDWDRKLNVVPRSEAVEDFIQEWDFPLSDAARKLLEAPRPVYYAITLLGSGRIQIETPYDPAMVASIRDLPGRSYKGGAFNTVDPDPAVELFQTKFGLTISPEALKACREAAGRQAVEAKKAGSVAQRREILGKVSRIGKPEDLVYVPEFLELLKGALDG